MLEACVLLSMTLRTHHINEHLMWLKYETPLATIIRNLVLSNPILCARREWPMCPCRRKLWRFERIYRVTRALERCSPQTAVRTQKTRTIRCRCSNVGISSETINLHPLFRSFIAMMWHSKLRTLLRYFSSLILSTIHIRNLWQPSQWTSNTWSEAEIQIFYRSRCRALHSTAGVDSKRLTIFEMIG